MEELIKSALDGNKDSYVALIKSIETELFKIASSQLNNIDDVNDAIQETILNSYSKLHTLKKYNYFKTWIIRILINECNNIHRKRKRELGLFNKITHCNSIDDNYTNKSEFQKIDSNIDFNLLIKKLKTEDRLILTLHYKLQYTPTEISNILKLNVNTIKSKILRAKQKLKQLYEKGGINDEAKK